MPAPDPDLDELELIRRSGVALRTGKLCLSAGHGSYRVKAAMARVAHALGIDRHEAHVTLTEITATSHRGRSFRTEVAEVRAIGVNADRLAELERFTRGLEQRRLAHAEPATVEGVTAELDRISGKPPLYPLLLNALWAAIACAAFAFLNNGGPVEILAVLVAAGLGQAGRRILLHRGWNQFGVTMLAAAVASLAYLGIVGVLRLAGVTAIQHESGYLSAVLFLIPGFALVTAALDLAKLDFSAGIARLVYGLMIVTSAALVVWGVSAAVGLQPHPVEPLALATGRAPGAPPGGQLDRGARLRADVQQPVGDGDRRRQHRHGRQRRPTRADRSGDADPGRGCGAPRWWSGLLAAVVGPTARRADDHGLGARRGDHGAGRDRVPRRLLPVDRGDDPGPRTTPSRPAWWCWPWPSASRWPGCSPTAPGVWSAETTARSSVGGQLIRSSTTPVRSGARSPITYASASACLARSNRSGVSVCRVSSG